MSIRCAPAALAASSLFLFAGTPSAEAQFKGELTTGVAASPLEIALPPTIESSRLKKRPDLLLSEWDTVMDDALTTIKENPLYQGSGTSGTNPLHTSALYIVSVPTVTLTYVHHEGIVHRDIAARMHFTVPGETSPLLVADVLLAVDDYALPGSTAVPDASALLGVWAGIQMAPAVLTFADGTPTGESLSVTGASWTFEVVAVPGPTAAAVMGLMGVVAATRRRTR